MIAPLPPDAPLGIYLHIPFCTRICPYCDFNRYAHQEHLIPDYVDALVREIELTRETLGRVSATTIYFGGGTPSLLSPDLVERVIQALHEQFEILPGSEVTLEANPERLDRDKLAGYRAAGVNRLSIGVQTQQAHGLRVLGRAHKPEIPQQALTLARETGFENLSVDFIFGWPGQTLDDWRRDLDVLLEWQPEHVSLYSLIIEPGTPFHEAVRRGRLIPADDDAAADMYELAIDRLGSAGWQHYEVSNWSRERGLESRHNAIYWQNGQYLGLGAGAHGHVDGVRAGNVRPTAGYMRRVAAGQRPVDSQETIDPVTAMSETMMLGLRLLQEGVSAPAFAARHDVRLEDVYEAELTDLSRLGLLDWNGRRARLTRRGLLLANDVAARFLRAPVTTS